MLVKLMGQPESEAESFDAKAGRVRDIGISQATYSRVFLVSLTLTAALATALVYGFGGIAAVHGELQVGTVVALASYLTRLYQPLTQLSNVNLDVMTALVSFERIFEVLDIEPMIEEDPDAVDVPRGNASIAFEDVDFTYPSAEEVSLASLESVAVLEAGQRGEVLHDVSFTVEPGQHGGAGGPLGSRQDDDLEPGAPPLRRHDGIGAPERHRCAARHHGVGARRGRRGDPGPAPLPRHAAGQPPVRPPGGERGRGHGRPGPGADRPPGRRPARRPRHGDRRARATGSRGARSSASPWPASS